MELGQRVDISHYLEILDEGNIDSLSQVHRLKQFIILLSFGDVGVDLFWQKDIGVNKHQ